MQHTITKPQTATDTKTFYAGPYSSVMLSADGLASTEKVTVNILIGNTVKAFLDSSGTAVTLTATKWNAALPGGPTYQLVKDVTAGACGVYADTVNAPR